MDVIGRSALLRAELRLVPEKDLAEALNIKQETLAQWRNAGKAPHYAQIGKSHFYRIQDIHEWIYEAVKKSAMEDKYRWNAEETLNPDGVCS